MAQLLPQRLKLYKIVFIHLKERWGEVGGETGDRDLLSVGSLPKCQPDLVRSKPEAWNSIQISHVDGRSPSIQTTFLTFTRS